MKLNFEIWLDEDASLFFYILVIRMSHLFQFWKPLNPNQQWKKKKKHQAKKKRTDDTFLSVIEHREELTRGFRMKMFFFLLFFLSCVLVWVPEWGVNCRGAEGAPCVRPSRQQVHYQRNTFPFIWTEGFPLCVSWTQIKVFRSSVFFSSSVWLTFPSWYKIVRCLVCRKVGKGECFLARFVFFFSRVVN